MNPIQATQLIVPIESSFLFQVYLNYVSIISILDSRNTMIVYSNCLSLPKVIRTNPQTSAVCNDIR